MYLKLCNKAFMQLTAINRLERFLGKKGLEVISNNFTYSIFNYCLTAGILARAKS